MTESTVNVRPLVTFALFAYNQAEYIREAIRGAFSQTYSPLEIILSDDCSSDGTYEIMKEMAAEYKGPHRLVVRRSAKNLGLVDHVFEVVEIATGHIVFLAAGDDYSVPSRVSEVCRLWKQDTAAAFSAYTLVDPDGRVLRDRVIPSADAAQRLPWMNCRVDSFVYGSTSVYSLRVLRSLVRARCRVMSEDVPLNIILQFSKGEVICHEDPLVRYRAHANTLSNSISLGSHPRGVLKAERVHHEKILRDIDLLYYIKSDILPAFPHKSDMVRLGELNRIIGNLEIKARWRALGVSGRLWHLYAADSALRKWMLPRMFGEIPYVLLKTISQLVRGHRADWKK